MVPIREIVKSWRVTCRLTDREYLDGSAADQYPALAGGRYQY
jgi:hypothetical protein